MKLSELVKIIEKKVADDAIVFEIVDGKRIEIKIDPEINIGFKLKGQGAQYSDFDIEYDEVFTRDQKEILITVKAE
ncbi:hypothetical protein JCM19314_946 [Nonlabens ulvanivorans]|uniref:Uncharacterized protein n=1 Tax=Nonlabens ulvanivorans TaxID=906888 RepID=A0A090QWD3_NONUL|nr:hypothetical protein [Nonlabens ulvanivorans]GAK99761.1 hypothetical protein JCM19314_946 [Nonlabens ulvanivorans]